MGVIIKSRFPIILSPSDQQIELDVVSSNISPFVQSFAFSIILFLFAKPYGWRQYCHPLKSLIASTHLIEITSNFFSISLLKLIVSLPLLVLLNCYSKLRNRRSLCNIFKFCFLHFVVFIYFQFFYFF